MIKASNNPFPCEPNDKYPDMLARGGYTGTAQQLKKEIDALAFPDDFIVIGKITKKENTISIQPLAFQWRIGQVLFENQDLFSTVITPATEGHNRIDIIVATDFGVFIKIQGIEGVDSAQEPPTPDNTLMVAFISVFGSEIATPTPPIIGDDLGNKEDKTNKGVAGGYAPLNEFVKIESEYLNIVNDLFTGGATSLLTAEQGKVLKTQIDNINVILTSDNVNMDNVQELVDAIETVQTSLSSILVNDLTTGGTTKALTAEMGKVLNENVLHKIGDEIKTGTLTANKFITAGGTPNHYIRGDGELAFFDDTISRNIIKDVTQSAAVTGTVSEVLLKTYLIPANTFKVEDVMHIKEFSTFEPIVESQNNRIRLRIGDANNFSTSAIILESYLNLTSAFNRIKASSSHSIRNGLIANVTLAGTVTNDIGRSKITYIPFDPTIDNYLFSSIQLVLSSSSISQLALIVTN